MVRHSVCIINCPPFYIQSLPMHRIIGINTAKISESPPDCNCLSLWNRGFSFAHSLVKAHFTCTMLSYLSSVQTQSLLHSLSHKNNLYHVCPKIKKFLPWKRKKGISQKLLNSLSKPVVLGHLKRDWLY